MNGIKLKKLRELRNFTQKYMAEQLGMTQQNYSKMEKSENEFSKERIAKLAQILDIDINKINSFDEKVIFSNNEFSFSGDAINVLVGESFAQIQKVHEKHLEDLKAQIQYLQEENKRLHGLLAKAFGD